MKEAGVADPLQIFVLAQKVLVGVFRNKWQRLLAETEIGVAVAMRAIDAVLLCASLSKESVRVSMRRCNAYVVC